MVSHLHLISVNSTCRFMEHPYGVC